MLHAKVTKDLAKMDRKISIYGVTEVEVDYGGTRKVLSAQPLATVWAYLEPKFRMMQEGIMSAKETSLQEFHWIIRKNSSLTLDQTAQVHYGGFVYDIIAIMPEGRDMQRLVTELKEETV